MANTYTQLYVHAVFAVQGRQSMILQNQKEELHKYITGIVRNKGQKLIAINCMPDHTHIFIGFKPNSNIADIIRDVKNNSVRFINEKQWVAGKFTWQEGYGAFTYSHSQLATVAKYIDRQEEHHKHQTFIEEYREMLEKFNIRYDERYIFKTD